MKTVLFLFFPFALFGQVSDYEDEIINEMCRTLNSTTELGDSLRIDHMYKKHLEPYLMTISQGNIDSVGMSIYYRLQIKCPTFFTILEKIESVNSQENKLVDTKPEISITKRDLKKFKQTKSFYYIEPENNKVEVKIEKNRWNEFYEDHSHSYNEIIWTDNHSFQLKFIESNNSIKKSISKNGEIYEYEIISKQDNFYEILYELPESNQFLIFKLYENK